LFSKIIDISIKLGDQYTNKITGSCFTVAIIGCVFWKFQFYKIGSILTFIPLIILFVLGLWYFILLILMGITELFKYIKRKVIR